MVRTMAKAVDQRVVFFMETSQRQDFKRQSVVKRASREIGRIPMHR